MDSRIAANADAAAAAKSVFRIMRHIDTHVHEKLPLDELAAMASYSPYHFHRLFKSLTGMTLGGYVLERRMSLVKRYLNHHPLLGMTGIAERAGFASPSDFSRAFKARFGETPTAYRARVQGERKICIADRKFFERYFTTTYYNKRQENGRSDIEPVRTLKVTVKWMPQYRVLYRPLLGSCSEDMLQDRLTEAFRQVAAMAAIRRAPSFQTLMIGSSHELTPMPDGLFRYRFDVCAAVPDTVTDEAELPAADLPGGLYAMIRLATRLEDVQAVLDNFYRQWLPASGYALGEGAVLASYGSAAAFQLGYPAYADYCIPIEERH
ncbi:GyrI-like domain-containing protein [Paenibacillus aurantiacus]|uniref:GyrI-like domain-containing protein n=1 Tax=Paenibacillus aurantiacus TaxID=1936118 RepID=A0ABV5KH41_9BACL